MEASKLRGAKSGALFWAGKHDGRVYALAFSPDGKFLASGVVDCGPADKPLKLWDAETGQLLRRLEGHGDSVYFVGFSPDGKTLVSNGGKDRTIQLWDTETGALLRTLRGHGDKVRQVVFSPDGKTLVSSGDDATIKVWDTATGALTRTFTGHSKLVMSVAFSPDGKLLASGSGDATVRLWNAETGKLLRKIVPVDTLLQLLAPVGKKLFGLEIDGHRYAVRAVAFSPDGKTLASASVDPVVKLWNVETAAE